MTQREFLLLVTRSLEACGIPYFVTGGFASIWYGEYRTTLDVDLVVDLSPDQARELARCFPEPDFYCDGDALAGMAREGGVRNIIHVPTGLKADLIRAPGYAFDRQIFDRVRRAEIAEGCSVNFASPEDVILKKLEFYDEGRSDRHLRDIAAILRVQGAVIDRAYIRVWATNLGIEVWWERVERLAGQSPPGQG